MQGYAVMCRASTARDVSLTSECTHQLALPWDTRHLISPRLWLEKCNN